MDIDAVNSAILNMTDMLETETRETLFVTDAEIIRRTGVPEKVMRVTIRSLDKNGASGFPRKQPLFGNRRYWPSVKSYLDRLHGVKLAASRRDTQ